MELPRYDYEEGEYIDEEGNRFWLDDEGEPDFDDPVITLTQWLGDFGISEDDAQKIQNKIIGDK